MDRALDLVRGIWVNNQGKATGRVTLTGQILDATGLTGGCVNASKPNSGEFFDNSMRGVVVDENGYPTLTVEEKYRAIQVLFFLYSPLISQYTIILHIFFKWYYYLKTFLHIQFQYVTQVFLVFAPIVRSIHRSK